jgi:hypothetical protein
MAPGYSALNWRGIAPILPADLALVNRQSYGLTPMMTPISAGIFLGDIERLWAGGESITLELQSRPQDVEIIRAFLISPQPQFNFINGGAK